MSIDILGTSCDQCWSTVQYSFTSTEARRLVRTDSPGRPPRLSHSSCWDAGTGLGCSVGRAPDSATEKPGADAGSSPGTAREFSDSQSQCSVQGPAKHSGLRHPSSSHCHSWSVTPQSRNFETRHWLSGTVFRWCSNGSKFITDNSN